MKKISRLSMLAIFLIAVLSVTSGVLAWTLINRAMDFTFKLGADGNIQLYSDFACTTVITTFDFGEFTEGQTQNKTVYVKNIGNVPANISWSVSTANWVVGSGLWDNFYNYEDSGTHWVLSGYQNSGALNWMPSDKANYVPITLAVGAVHNATYSLQEVDAIVDQTYTVTIDIVGSET